MRPQFTLRTMFLAILIAIGVLWILKPVAGINATTCSQILPGMTEAQAQEIVGVPPGWYDGIGGIQSDAPAIKGYRPSWVGWHGEITIDLDESGRVAAATFYPAKILHWSPLGYLWERFTWVKYMGLTFPARIFLYSVLVAVVTLILGKGFVRADAYNAAASQGLIGLGIGSVIAVAIFSDGFFEDLLATTMILSGPITGAVIGVAVGYGRSLRVKSREPRPSHDKPSTARTATA